jgi:AraC-like DNA-binding protein
VKILTIGCFTHPQSFTQTTNSSWLNINLGGFIKQSIKLATTGHSTHLKSDQQQFASLLSKGSTVNFEYGDDRENWVIMLPDNVIQEKTINNIQLSLGDLKGELPAYHPLNITQAEKCREYLKRILHSFHNPNIKSTLSINLILHSLLDCIINPELPIEQEQPTQALRKRIISDTHFSKTIHMHSRECGYSVDHIRRLFEEQFNISPQIFRMNYRMRLASDLLKNHKLSAKAVSDQLGFNTPSHFSLTFKKHFNCSPGAYQNITD